MNLASLVGTDGNEECYGVGRLRLRGSAVVGYRRHVGSAAPVLAGGPATAVGPNHRAGDVMCDSETLLVR